MARSVFREVNERIRALAERWGDVEERDFLCECGRRDCREAVSLTVDEYDIVRAEGAGRFLVAARHAAERAENVIVRNGRFCVVQPRSKS
ncbi:MAG: hypothetical protein HOQ28_03565 [Thermoleophilia bacterium]|nr:hypothetical protein [Thermoleophilia bacterium]